MYVYLIDSDKDLIKIELPPVDSYAYLEVSAMFIEFSITLIILLYS